MDKYKEIAASIIDQVLDAMHNEHPEIKQVENSSLIYGESYYNLESMMATDLMETFRPFSDEELSMLFDGIENLQCDGCEYCTSPDNDNFNGCNKCALLETKITKMKVEE